MYFPSSYYRLKARSALKGHWQTALLIALVVNLPTMLMQGVSAFTGNDALARLQYVIVSASRDGMMSSALLQQEIDAILGSTQFWVIRGVEVVAWLITPCLSLGMFKWLMDRLRGGDGPVSTVFCRAGIFLKAIGLQLLIILKVLLWMLPGIAVTAAVFASTAAPRIGTLMTVEQQYALLSSMNMLTPLAIAAIAVPGVLAALRYALAEYIQADEPETKITDCIRRSRQLMAGNKKNLFFLMLSFLLWYLLELLVASYLSGMGAGVVSLVFQMLVALALHVYTSAAVAAFFLTLAKGGPEEAKAEEAEQEGETQIDP